MSLPEDYRQKAMEQREVSKQLLEDVALLEKPKLLVAAIVGQVNATILSSLADVMDYLRVTTGSDSRQARLQQILDRSDAVRMASVKASATGDWSEFDKLVKGEANGSGK